MTKTRYKARYKTKVTREMKRCYSKIEIPPNPIFTTREIPILILKRLATLIEEYTPAEENMEGGLFFGAAGVGYALLKCADYPLYEPIREHLLFTAKSYIDASLEHYSRDDLQPLSILLGKAGIYAVAAVIYKKLGLFSKARECVHLFQAQGAHCLVSNYNPDGGEDLCTGRAGYLTGALWLRKYFKQYFSRKFFYQQIDLMIESCRIYAQKVFSYQPLAYSYYDNQLTGILTGLSGVLFTILCFPSYLDKHPEVDQEVKKSVDSILLRQTADGSFYIYMDSCYTIAGDILKWRSGAPGILHLMIKAYLRWNHSRYYYSCILIADLIWNFGLEFILTEGRNGSGVGLDHGFVGNVYGLLVLYRLTKHPIYLQQAHICSIILKNEKHYKNFVKRENIFSLFNGLAGTLLYLLDVIHIENAEFPFLPIFSSFDEFEEVEKSDF